MNDLLVDGRQDFALIFLHSDLDDYGLDASVFRVYAHLSRRAGSGAAFPAIRSIAQVCRLHPATVRAALRTLARFRLITRDARPGRTPLYRLTPKSAWLPAIALASQPSRTDTPSNSIQATPPNLMQGYPSQDDIAEGNPIEGNPQKERGGGGGAAPALQEIPSDEEVLEFGQTFPGQRGMRGPMDQMFVVCWLSDVFGRREFPPNWKRHLVAAWRLFLQNGAARPRP